MAGLLRLSQGAFVTFTGSRFRIGHANDPYRAYEVHRTVLHLVAAFAEPSDPDTVLDRLRLAGGARAALAGLLDDLRTDGILEEPHGDPPAVTVKTAEREVARVTSHVADIEAMYPEFTAAWRTVSPHTLTSVPLGFALWNACRYLVTGGIDGAVVECGVWRGGSMMLAALALAGEPRPREIRLFDTFDNFAGGVTVDDDGFVVPGGQFTDTREAALLDGVGEADVVGRVVGAGHPAERVVTVPGKVQDTLPEQAPDRIALLRLDTDHYDSTRHELEHLYPRLVPGGVLIVDDYGRLAGATEAVDEYFAGLPGPAPLLHRVDVQGRVAVKPG